MLAQIRKQRKRLENRYLTVTGLTDRQAHVLMFILSCWLHGWLPTVRDIGDHFGISSPNGVMCHLTALRKKGYLHNDPGRGYWLAERAIQVAVGAKT